MLPVAEAARSRVVARAAIAPLFAGASLRAEQVTQLVLGETARVEELTGEWRRVRCDHDGYEGWVHAGYVLELDEASAAAWRSEAAGWSLGATLRRGHLSRRLPLRARPGEGQALRRAGLLRRRGQPDPSWPARAPRRRLGAL